MNKLTIQDYINLSQGSISNYFANFLPIFTNIVAAIVAVAIGVVLGWILKRVVEEVSKALGVERALSSLPFYSTLSKSHKETDLTTIVGEAARWSAIIVFLFAAIGSLQITGSEAVFSQLFSYIENAIIAGLYLLFGFVIAWFLHRIVMAVAAIVGNHPAHLLANFVYLAVIVFAAIQALGVLGVGAEVIRLLIIAALAVGALAFGLAGRDAAGDMIKKFFDRAKE